MMFRLLVYWWQKRLRSGWGLQAQPSYRRGVWPRLEALEDRCVPSTLAVTRSNDDVTQRGTLRYAVAHAESGDTILLAADVKDTPIVLTQGELLLNQDVTIRGAGEVSETISGGGASRVFEVAAGAHVSLLNLTISD